jgi:TM2 domain-containing membrane protein YozV
VHPITGSRFCIFCGTAVHVAAVVCVKCGRALHNGKLQAGSVHTGNQNAANRIVAPNSPKSPLLMAFLSLFFAGLGQLVLGQVAKGLLLMFVSLLLIYIYPILALIAGIDAYYIAKKLGEGRSVGRWEFF